MSNTSLIYSVIYRQMNLKINQNYFYMLILTHQYKLRESLLTNQF